MLKKPIIKSIIVLLKDLFSKKNENNISENIIGISLATNYQHLKYYNQ